jgi:hypothetical protein
MFSEQVTINEGSVYICQGCGIHVTGVIGGNRRNWGKIKL